jgi:hypothetical protein
MENEHRDNENPGSNPNIAAVPTKKKSRNNESGAKGSKKKTTNQRKKPLCELWHAASALKRFELILLIIAATGALGAIGYFIAYLVFTVRQEKRADYLLHIEHRPRIIFSRQPEFRGTFSCDITATQIHTTFGITRIFVKNIGHGDASSVFVNGPQFTLVPEKKIGVPLVDAPPKITEDVCRPKLSPKARVFALNSGQEYWIDMGPGGGTVNLAPGPYIAKDAILQLYAPICTYYAEENGDQHGTCDSYRLILNTASASFTCSDSPIIGKLELMPFQHCQN